MDTGPRAVTKVSEVILPGLRPSRKIPIMQVSRSHLAIALGSAGLLVLVFLGYLYWLSNQPPVLSRSEERDPLTQMPISITMNPFRDRTIEHTANSFIAEMRDGDCHKLLGQWEKDYRKKRADFLCNSEAQHPLISWTLVEWEDAPPLVILHYRGKRYSSPAQDSTYKDLFSVTEEKKDEGWTVTKYDSFY
jgi:predicted SnoaL-like aldol condensation-catalyzing enzyme